MERCFHSNPACLPFLQPFLLGFLEAMNRVYNKIFLIEFLLWIFKHKNYIRVIKETLMYLPPSWIINKITIGEAPCVVPLFGYKIILSSKCWKEKNFLKFIYSNLGVIEELRPAATISLYLLLLAWAVICNLIPLWPSQRHPSLSYLGHSSLCVQRIMFCFFLTSYSSFLTCKWVTLFWVYTVIHP